MTSHKLPCDIIMPNIILCLYNGHCTNICLGLFVVNNLTVLFETEFEFSFVVSTAQDNNGP
jgi:hypothetical protein